MIKTYFTKFYSKLIPLILYILQLVYSCAIRLARWSRRIYRMIKQIQDAIKGG